MLKCFEILHSFLNQTLLFLVILILYSGTHFYIALVVQGIIICFWRRD